FAMRTSDKDWAKNLRKKGQLLAPQWIHTPDADGRHIHAVEISAMDSLPPVMFVHGSPGSSDAFTDYLADTVLSGHARLVAIDRPGFGYTEAFGRPEPSLEKQAMALKTVLDQIAPGEKALLVGHSLGGPIVAKFAMMYPEQTAGLLIVAGSIDPAQEEHPWWQGAIHVPPLKWVVPKALWASNAEIIPLEKELEQMRPAWTEIRCPVRLIHAVNDRLVPVENVAFAREALAHLPGFKADILPDGDHFILWNQQPLVKAAILGMLQEAKD
ncbi:MAG: alpha/beta hydrolase, partial [Saprospiraceae bacterium]|nr:alpha/beta hydrolase [Saprospiraceae bacterium]